MSRRALFNEDGTRGPSGHHQRAENYQGRKAVFIGTSDTGITKATLVRLSSVTHAFNQNQRFNELTGFSAVSGGVTVAAPALNLAPPGHYLLFILRGRAPSVAEIVQLVAPSAVNDFDGDGGSDLSVFRHPTGEWFWKAANSTGSPATITWGRAGSSAGRGCGW
jgi:hypothetical protein